MEPTTSKTVKKKSAKVKKKFTLKQFRKKSANLRKAEVVQIPEEKLKEALNMLNAPIDDPIWTNIQHTSCQPYSHHQRVGVRSSTRASSLKETHILKYAQHCLLVRDWPNLARILSNPGDVPVNLFPLYTKYATLLLAHYGKRELMESYLHGLQSEYDTEGMLLACTSLQKEDQITLVESRKKQEENVPDK